MLNSTHQMHERTAALPTYASKSKSESTTSRDTTDVGAPSFGQQLANALESYFNQASSGSSLELTITPQGSQDSGSRQFFVTVTSPSGETPTLPAPAASSTPAASALINYGATSPFTYGAAKFAAEHPEGAPDTAEAASTQPEKPANETDAYWAQFPEEVQALRDIPDREDRISAAEGLVAQGFTVDWDIMVMGNDPYATMLIRQQTGYTWGPAMGQPNIEIAPGLQFPGKPSYDPNDPPPGSIPVSLDFAKGLESTSPAMQYNVTPTS